METKQTAVEYLLSFIWSMEWVDYSDEEKNKILTKVKQMETEQIKQAHNTGFIDAYDWPHKRNAEQYYNETYGN